MLDRVQTFVREHELIAPGGEVTCLVSGGADSTCLWHALQELGYGVRAVHVHHGVRGAEADEDARHCRELLGAEVMEVPPAATEVALRELRYAAKLLTRLDNTLPKMPSAGKFDDLNEMFAATTLAKMAGFALTPAAGAFLID